jgi:hypothetical protein
MDMNETPLPPKFTPPPMLPIEPKRSKKGAFFALGCGGCAVITFITIIGGGWFFVQFGMAVLADQVQAELQDNPVVIEHLGRIENFEMEMMKSMSTSIEDEYIFRAEGTKDSGVITAICITLDSETEDVTSGTLQVSSGEIFDLFPGFPAQYEKE